MGCSPKGSAPKDYGVWGKSVKSKASYLDKYDDPQRKLIGFGNGAPPRAQIRGDFFVDHLGCQNIQDLVFETAEKVIYCLGARPFRRSPRPSTDRVPRRRGQARRAPLHPL